MSKKYSKAPISYEADYKYKDAVLSKLINTLMWQGKKATSIRIVYDSLDFLKTKIDANPLETFHKAIDNIKPELEVKSRRVGGATYQIPMEISANRKQALALRWIIMGARKRSGKSMAQKLGNELLDAFNSTGVAFKKKEETHRTAEANKAFSHYRW